MRTIDHKAFTASKRRTTPIYKKRVFIIAAVVAALFLLANGVVAFAYRNKALPGYKIDGISIAGKPYKEVQTVIKEDLLPDTITLEYKQVKKQVTVADSGIAINQQATLDSVKDKPIFPIFSLFTKTDVSFKLAVDQPALATALNNLKPDFSKAPTNRHVAFNGTAFVAAAAEKGYELDINKTRNQLLKDVAASKPASIVHVQTLPAGDNTIELTDELAALNKQLATDIQFTVKDQTVTPSKQDIGNWYVPEGNTMKLSDEKVASYLQATAQKAGATLANGSDLLNAIKYAMPKQLKAHVQMSDAATTSLRTYCVAAKGAPDSLLGDVAGKLALTYADVRGWNAGGALAFKRVDTGCSYTVWLTAPSLMTSFGAICDDFYNCQVGTNVIINSARWQEATEPWRQTGQDVEAYRLLIINHETGHRLGLRDHNVCPGAGQPAYVMMQQSIDLKGCTFNVWPLPSELAAIKSML